MYLVVWLLLDEGKSEGFQDRVNLRTEVAFIVSVSFGLLIHIDYFIYLVFIFYCIVVLIKTF